MIKRNDTVTGYDSLNRLVAAQATAGPYQGLQATWSYDSFGNRTGETFGGNTGGVTAPIPANTSNTYSANNQIASTLSGFAPSYDSAGNVTCDNFNTSTSQCMGQDSYLYDAEGRVCAVQNLGTMTGYLYDAEGNRIAKGTISSWSCNTAQNGFSITTSSILGPGNEQLTELAWSGSSPQWAYSNVYAAGQLMATYSPDPDTSQGIQAILNYHLTDWLGTRRVLTDAVGNIQATCLSLPYGNGETCTPTPTEELFAGLQRDAESGLDHATYRQYGSMTGRWTSPDPYFGSMDPNNPQSFNRYAYVGNMPMTFTDPSGLDGGGGAVLCAAGPEACVAAVLLDVIILDILFGHHAATPKKPRPSAPDEEPDWDNAMSETLGMPAGWSPPAGLGNSVGQALGLPSAGCEFGACGAGPSSLTPGQTAQLGGPILIPPSWLFPLVNLFHFPYADSSDPNHRLFGTHYCGPGGGGAPTGGLDILCAAHDACYRANGVSAIDNLNPFTSGSAMGGCDRLLCTELGQYHPKSGQEAVGRNQISQIFGCGYINR